MYDQNPLKQAPRNSAGMWDFGLLATVRIADHMTPTGPKYFSKYTMIRKETVVKQ